MPRSSFDLVAVRLRAPPPTYGVVAILHPAEGNNGMGEFFVRASNAITRTPSGRLIAGKRLSHTLSVRRRDGTFQELVGVTFDTGAQHTVIPTAMADRFDVPYSRDPDLAVKVTGSTGEAVAYTGQATVRFTELPGWEFDVPCLFVDGAKRILFGLPDQLRNFDFRSCERAEGDRTAILGVLYALRANHAGRLATPHHAAQTQ